MRILKVFDGDYPWDVRVEKIVGTLLGAGHTVRLLCRNRQGRPRRQTLDGLEIERLPPVRPASLSVPLFFNPLWAAALAREIRRFRPDRILVRDLPLAPLAVWLGARFGVPVVADLSEPYPDSLRSQRQFEDLSSLARLVRNPRAAEVVERYVLRRAACVLFVCPEAAQRVGMPEDRWAEVGNTPRLEAFVARGGPAPELAGLEGRFVLLFCGLLAGDRGIEVALDALDRLRAREPGRYALVVVGDGPVRERLVRRTHDLGLGGDVRFTGFVAHDRLPDLISRAQAGLLPFHVCPHISSTLANKLFEYMSLGLPVVCSDVPPMLRILDETHAGVSFRSGDAGDLARAIEALAADPEASRARGEAGRKAVQTRYHWGVDAERLLAALERR